MASLYEKRRTLALGEGGREYLQKRQEISQAAGRVFKRKGLSATNVNDIATEAEVDRATLYYYFGSKQEIFEEVVTAAVTNNAKGAEVIRLGPGTGPDKLRNLIVSLMVSYAAHYPFLYVFIQENLTQLGKTRPEWSKAMRDLNHQYEASIIGIIQDGIADGTLSATGDAKTIAYGLLGMLGWTNRWFSPEDSSQSAEEIGNTFADVFLGGLIPRG